jgi:hypothetical protein
MSLSGFALPYIADTIISMILYDFAMQFADRRVPWKIANSAENQVLEALQI